MNDISLPPSYNVIIDNCLMAKVGEFPPDLYYTTNNLRDGWQMDLASVEGVLDLVFNR